MKKNNKNNKNALKEEFKKNGLKEEFKIKEYKQNGLKEEFKMKNGDIKMESCIINFLYVFQENRGNFVDVSIRLPNSQLIAGVCLPPQSLKDNYNTLDKITKVLALKFKLIDESFNKIRKEALPYDMVILPCYTIRSNQDALLAEICISDNQSAINIASYIHESWFN